MVVARARLILPWGCKTPVAREEIADVIDAARSKERFGYVYERSLEIARRDSSDALELASALLDALPEGPVFFDAVLSYVADDDLGVLVADAVHRLHRSDTPVRKSEAAEAVIAYSSLQAPRVLEPHLAAVWFLRPNADTYYEMWPWRGATAEQARDLQRICSDSNLPDADRFRAWEGLLETRQPSALGDAIGLARTVERYRVNTVAAHLHRVGFDVDETQTLRPLTREPVLHMQFPFEYFRDGSRRIWARRSTHLHPTWRTDAAPSVAATVGGHSEATCAICGRALMRLFLMEHGTAEIGVISRKRLELSICDACVSFSQSVFYAHDDSGAPQSIPLDRALNDVDEWEPVSLVPAQVDLVRSSPRWDKQDWALSDSRENLYRVGGEPTWIQSAEFPVCPRCSVRMPFLMQFDSDLPDVKGGEWSCGSGSGIVYVFWCDPCAISAASIQDT